MKKIAIKMVDNNMYYGELTAEYFDKILAKNVRQINGLNVINYNEAVKHGTKICDAEIQFVVNNILWFSIIE